MSSEEGEGISWPQAIALVPSSHVGSDLEHILSKGFDVELPVGCTFVSLQILEEDRAPLLACHNLTHLLLSLLETESFYIQLAQGFHVVSELVESLIILMIQGTAFEKNNSGEPTEVVGSSHSCQLSSKSVSSNGCHSDLLLIHKSNDIVAHFVHII